MTHSPRYQEVKSQISPDKFYSLPESLDFLQKKNSENSKNIKVSFSLNQTGQKTATNLKRKIVLPYPLPPKGKIAVIKDDLPEEIMKQLTKNKEVELLSLEEAHQRTVIEKTNKVRKRSQWGFEKILIQSQNEKKFKSLLSPKLFGWMAKKIVLTENLLEEVDNFRQGEQGIRTDKGGNIHALIGKSDYSIEQLEKNYQTLYNEVNKLRPAKWKGAFLRKITLSTTMGPGLKVYLTP